MILHSDACLPISMKVWGFLMPGDVVPSCTYSNGFEDAVDVMSCFDVCVLSFSDLPLRWLLVVYLFSASFLKIIHTKWQVENKHQIFQLQFTVWQNMGHLQPAVPQIHTGGWVVSISSFLIIFISVTQLKIVTGARRRTGNWVKTEKVVEDQYKCEICILCTVCMYIHDYIHILYIGVILQMSQNRYIYIIHI